MKPESPQDERWLGALALSVVGSVVTGLALWMPADGWSWQGRTVRLEVPSEWRPWLTPEAPVSVIPRWKPEDVAELLAAYDSGWTAASTAVPDSLFPNLPEPTVPIPLATDPAPADSLDPGEAPSDTPHSQDSSAVLPAPEPRPVRTAIPDAGALPPALRLVIPESARPAFGRLFAGLEEHGQVEVLHYGDSQIEGDRISGVLRHAWQTRWGGYGPGLQAAVPLVQSFALRQSHSGPWRRHTRYGRRDTTDTDERYGLLGCYADIPQEDTGVRPCLSLSPEPRAHEQFSRWNRIRIWHDTIAANSTILVNDRPMDTLIAGTPASVLELPLVLDSQGQRLEEEARICFDGPPPRIFALEPVGSGVQWHGVPMRGSSGTLFRKLERSHLRRQLHRLDPELVILQYGGNMVPHCPDVAGAERYAGWFASQIRLFRMLLPEAAILVIGPSDMAEKQGAEWTSFPMLTSVRDALKRVAAEEGAGYWDLLEVMGGPGSMPAWVASSPALAGPDHVHFTPLGAKRVGTLLDRSFLACYGEWKREWAQPPPSTLPRRGAVTIAPSSGTQSLMEPHVPD